MSGRGTIRERPCQTLPVDSVPMGDIEPGAECYHLSMRQLISRIDDRLHARLKERARDEGRSMNSLVTELIERGLEGTDARARLKARLRAEGRLVEPPRPKRVPTWEEVVAAGKGVGTAVSDALREDRAKR